MFTHTHVLVQSNTAAKAQKSGRYAMVSICFGPGDKDKISAIMYEKNGHGKKPGFILPQQTFSGSKVPMQVFTGRVAEKIVEICTQAMKRVKKSQGKIPAGKTFRVTGDQVTEV